MTDRRAYCLKGFLPVLTLLFMAVAWCRVCVSQGPRGFPAAARAWMLQTLLWPLSGSPLTLQASEPAPGLSCPRPCPVCWGLAST